jgi:hypothetical protein
MTVARQNELICTTIGSHQPAVKPMHNGGYRRVTQLGWQRLSVTRGRSHRVGWSSSGWQLRRPLTGWRFSKIRHWRYPALAASASLRRTAGRCTRRSAVTDSALLVAPGVVHDHPAAALSECGVPQTIGSNDYALIANA